MNPRFFITVFLSLIITEGIFAQPSKNQIMPAIIAHRGASFYAPENTLASARLGWEQNADAVEIDIYLTPDKRIVVIHDGNTKRTTGVSYKVAETHSDTLRLLDAGNWKDVKYKGERIPYLEEVLQLIPSGKKLVIEIKCGPEVVPFLKTVIEKSKKSNQCLIISFNFEALAAAKQAIPAIPMYYLSSKVSPADFEGLWTKLKDKGIDGLNLNYSTITPELANLCKKNSVPLFAWTVDKPEDILRMIELGVQGITTNKPLETREVIAGAVK